MAVKIIYKDGTTEIIRGAAGTREDKLNDALTFINEKGDVITQRKDHNIKEVKTVDEPPVDE